MFRLACVDIIIYQYNAQPGWRDTARVGILVLFLLFLYFNVWFSIITGAPKVFAVKGPLNLIMVITVNTLGLHTVLQVSQPPPGAPVARGQLTLSPITDTDMVLDTTDTDTWVLLDTPDTLPLLLPGRIFRIIKIKSSHYKIRIKKNNSELLGLLK